MIRVFKKPKIFHYLGVFVSKKNFNKLDWTLTNNVYELGMDFDFKCYLYDIYEIYKIIKKGIFWAFYHREIVFLRSGADQDRTDDLLNAIQEHVLILLDLQD